MRLVRGTQAADGEEAFVDPSTKEAWFRNLPEEYQQRFGKHFEEEIERKQELERREKRRIWKETGAGAVVLAVFDTMSPAQTLETTLFAAVVGAAIGWLCSAMGATRSYAPVMGMSVFLAYQLMTRGRLFMVHFLLVVLLGAVFAYLGYRREGRHDS